MQWATATVPVSCGSCGVRLARGDVVVLVTEKKKPRCTACARKMLAVISRVADELELALDAADELKVE